MKHLITIASLVLASSAAHAGLYLKGSALFADVDNLRGSTSFDAAVDRSTGFTLGAGYRFTILSVEVEGLALESDITGAEGGGASGARGSYEQAALFVNVIVDIPGIPLVTPYVGVGAGFGRVDFSGDVTFSDLTQGSFSGDDTAWGFQAFVGVRVGLPLTGLGVYANYRYYDLSDAKVGSIGSNVLEARGTSAVELGLRYEF